jgi:hypothetical protein
MYRTIYVQDACGVGRSVKTFFATFTTFFIGFCIVERYAIICLMNVYFNILASKATFWASKVATFGLQNATCGLHNTTFGL